MRSLSALLTDFSCEIRGPYEDRAIEQIEYDSRKATEASLFFCLPGAKADGHDFALSAYDNGARAFVVERFLTLPDDAVQIKVPNARAALAILSARFFGNPADRLTVIGVTGTKGKTTTSILIQEILSKQGIKCGYIGSNGVFIGDRHYETINSTPESRELHRFFALMVESGYTHVAMEVSSQALDHDRVTGIRFDTVVYTNLSEDHVGPGEHASFEEYRDAKHKLFTDYGAAHIVCNTDDANAAYMMKGASGVVVSYGLDPTADFSAEACRPYRDATSLGIEFDAVHNGVKTGVRLRQPGKFSVYNGLAALAVVSQYGVSVRDAADALRTISICGRFEIVDALPGVTFIIDYAHNGLSLTRALTELRAYEPRKLICVFGCIGGRTVGRRRELAEAAGTLADYTIISSDNPDFEDPDAIIEDVLRWFDRTKPYTVIADREEAVRCAVRMANDGDIVLFAGKGHETYQLIRGEKVPFIEKNVLLDEADKRAAREAAVSAH